VPLPDDKVGRLVADHFPPVMSGEASDGQVELDETVVDSQSGDGCRQAPVEPEPKPLHTCVSPDTRQRPEIDRR
jgi:hypothetical protein